MLDDRRIGDCKLRAASRQREGSFQAEEATVERAVTGGGRRKGKSRMQRIRKELSPAPAYVMPSSHCQPAPPAPLLSREREGRGSSPREPRENSDRADIDLRPIICMLIVRPSDENSADNDAGATNNIPAVARAALTDLLQLSSPSDRGHASVAYCVCLRLLGSRLSRSAIVATCGHLST